MPETLIDPAAIPLTSPSGMRVEINANGSVRRLDCDAISLTLFVGNEMEVGPTNLYLRRHSDLVEWIPMLGPLSRTRFHSDPATGMPVGVGAWLGINYSIALVLAMNSPAWFWHVRLDNTNATSQLVDLTYAQDLAYDTSRVRNELGYKEIVSVDEGLRRTIAAVRENPPVIDTAQYAAEDAALASRRISGLAC